MFWLCLSDGKKRNHSSVFWASNFNQHAFFKEWNFYNNIGNDCDIQPAKKSKVEIVHTKLYYKITIMLKTCIGK